MPQQGLSSSRLCQPVNVFVYFRLERVFINYKLTPQELHQYWFGLDIGVKCLRISVLATPYCPTPVFMPTRTPIKGFYSRQLLLGRPMDINLTFKDEAQWL